MRVTSEAESSTQLNRLVCEGGESLMLRAAAAPYTTRRSEVLLKLEPQDYDEAVVLSHQHGEGRLKDRACWVPRACATRLAAKS